MGNTSTKTRLYGPQAIGNILRIARERCCQEERRTKRYMARELGITEQRLTNIEKGFSQPPFELAVEWCRIVEDDTALEQIKHIYLDELPPTDPRLLQSVPEQLVNFIRQSNQAIEAAKKLLMLTTELRPGKEFDVNTSLNILKFAEEILDSHQASECVLDSLEVNWGLNRNELYHNWILEAIKDEVIIKSVSQYEDIRKEEFFDNRKKYLRRLDTYVNV